MRYFTILTALLLAHVALAQVHPLWEPYLKDAEVTKRRDVVMGLRNKPTRADLRLAAAALSDPDDMVRSMARSLLRNNKGPNAFHATVAALPYTGRIDAYNVLMYYTEQKYVDLMIPLLKHRLEPVRWSAVWILGLTKNRKAFWPLVRTLKDPNDQMRWDVSISIMRFDDKPHRDALLKLLKHKEPRYRDGAADALGFQREARAFEPLIKLWQGDSDQQVRWSALVALGKFKEPEQQDRIFEMFKSDQAWLRKDAAFVLGNMGGSRYIDALFEAMLHDGDSEVRRECHVALMNIGHQAVPKFVELLKNPVPRERGTAAIALGKIKSPDVRKPLLTAVTDPDPVVRMYAAEGLGRFFDVDVIAALEKAVQDPDDRVKNAARASLARAKSRRSGYLLPVELHEADVVAVRISDRCRPADVRQLVLRS